MEPEALISLLTKIVSIQDDISRSLIRVEKKLDTLQADVNLLVPVVKNQNVRLSLVEARD